MEGENKYIGVSIWGKEVSMSKITTTIQRCKLLNRPARLAVSGTQSSGLANWASLTKYTAIATLALAIAATMILNIVGGGSF